MQLTADKSILDLDAESSFSPGDAVLKLVNFNPRYSLRRVSRVDGVDGHACQLQERHV